MLAEVAEEAGFTAGVINVVTHAHGVLIKRLRGLIEKFPNFAFTEPGEGQAFNGVGKLDWGFGSAGQKAVITGIDVLVMKGEKIVALYTFLDPPKK